VFATQGKKLLQCYLNTWKEAAWLIHLEQTLSIDIWEHHPLKLKSHFRVLVHDGEEEFRLRQIVTCSAVQSVNVEENVFFNRKGNDFFESFHSYDEIVDKVHEWADMYPDLITLSSVGKSIEFRDIILMNITDKNYYGPKKVIWWNGGQHAREWISPAVVLYLAERLLEKKENQVSDFLRNVPTYLISRWNLCLRLYKIRMDMSIQESRIDIGERIGVIMGMDLLVLI
jgi:hypothetical protein